MIECHVQTNSPTECTMIISGDLGFAQEFAQLDAVDFTTMMASIPDSTRNLWVLSPDFYFNWRIQILGIRLIQVKNQS